MFNAEGAGSGGGDAAAAGDKAAAPAAGAEAAAGGDAKAAAAPAIDDAAKAASEALAGAKNPTDEAAAGDDKSAKEGDDPEKVAADKAKKEAEEAEAAKWEAPSSEIYQALKYPEGVEVAPEVIQPFLDEFKAEKIAPELAQKIVDWHLKAQAQVEQGWVSEITTQWEAFTKDTEFCKDNKLTPAAEQAYGAVRALSPEVASFFTFLNKNGGMFHPGLVNLVKLVSKGVSEGKIMKDNKPVVKDGGGADAFYAKSNNKK